MAYRTAKKKLRTRFERIIQRAGLNPWPRLFQNLRSSRETELAERYPIQVVVAWLGNSDPVAKKHYLQVTADHFGKAIECSALQNPVQSAHAMTRRESPRENPDNGLESISPDELLLVARTGWKSKSCKNLQNWATQDSNL